jgi:hypothetical protein
MTDVGTLQTVVDQQRHNCLQRRDAIRRVVPGADLIDELMPLCFALAHAGRGVSVCAAPQASLSRAPFRDVTMKVWWQSGNARSGR